MKNLVIPDSVYPYLRVQKGEINHIEDRTSFEIAYNQGLHELLYQMLPHIPLGMQNSLDVGSGMGGIDILLQRHFNQDVILLDAANTPPICTKHDIAFNNAQICEEFFIANNCRRNGYITPEEAKYTNWKGILKFDLILSIGSYCFHYSPEVYLDFIKASCHKDTVLILDVRNRHNDWLKILRENFLENSMPILVSEKFTRRVFKPKC